MRKKRQKNIVETKIAKDGRKIVVVTINGKIRKTTYAPRYEDLREIIAQLGILYGKEEVVRELGLGSTTDFPEPKDRRFMVLLPKLVDDEIKKRNLNLVKLVEDGFLLMKCCYGKVIDEIEGLKCDLLSRATITRKYMNKFKVIEVKFNVNRDKSVLRVLIIKKKLGIEITDMARRLDINLSSMIRLCVYHSLLESGNQSDSFELLDKLKKEVEKFKIDLLEAKVVLLTFKRNEEIWCKKKDEWLRELKESRIKYLGGDKNESKSNIFDGGSLYSDNDNDRVY